MRILSYTNLFPNFLRPNFGVFVKNRMQVVAKHACDRLDIIAPVPYCPPLPLSNRWSGYNQINNLEVIDGMRVRHPRYVVIPKVGMFTHGYSMYWGTRKLVRRLHERYNYQVIDAHWIYPDGFAAVKIAKELGLPVVVSARGNDINEYIDFPLIRPQIKWCLQNSDHVISVCQALKDLMLRLEIPESKISVIGNGIDTGIFYPVPRELAWSRLGLPCDRPVLLSVGILEERKGHHILIDALRILKKERSSSPFLVIVGSGPQYDALCRQISDSGLTHDVVLVGEVAHRELKTWYSAADVFCLASDREGWPNVILEAIACGTPVIASSVFGVSEIIADEAIGLLVHQRTAEAFAAKILEALGRQWETKTLVGFAKQHSWDKVAHAVRGTFMRVLDNSRNTTDRKSFGQ